LLLIPKKGERVFQPTPQEVKEQRRRMRKEDTVTKKGSGWVDYMFPKPGQTQPSQKWSYVKGVKIDGGLGLIGAGFYPA